MAVTHNIGIQINGGELTKTFMIQIDENPFVSMAYTIHI